MNPSSVPDSRNTIKFTLENDKRDIKDLWNEALKDYRGIVGKALPLQTKSEFHNVDDMIKFGALERDVFEKWRHDGKSLDKVRSLLMTNISLVEMGTQKLLAAATPAFPPAAAIGTALTFVLNACKGQSADYDMITSFFGEMNNFLQRVTILEDRLPEYGAYQTCLMDVFTAFLRMCAFATKFISKGRLKTWFVTSFTGQDPDLSSSRNQLTKKLGILESATQFAILANTEGLRGGQQGLQIMQVELRENQVKQYRLEQEQTELLHAIQQNQTDVQDSMNALRTDLQAITALMKQKETSLPGSTNEIIAQGQNSIRAAIRPNAENDTRLRKIRETRVSGTGEWLFEKSSWKSWLTTQDSGVLLLQGLPGVGKSHLATAVYDYLCRTAKQDPSQNTAVVFFFCDRNVGNLDTFDSFVSTTVLQVADQNMSLHNQFRQEFAHDRETSSLSLSTANEYVQKLIFSIFWSRLETPALAHH